MGVETTNYEKFQTRNPVVLKLIQGFFTTLSERVAAGPTNNLLDAGCGEGMTLNQLSDLLPENTTGFDINPDCVDFVSKAFPSASITCENIYELPYADKTFDLVLCLEVLEHLDDPVGALKSLKRVSSSRLVLSVPHEPWFQLGSLLRGKHLSRLGNHPEHINHWSPKTFERLLKELFSEVKIYGAFPWIIAEVKV